jgi:hypothetical protein
MNMAHFLQEILDISVLGGKFRSRVENPRFRRKVLVSGGKFQAMLVDNYPGIFRGRQIVVLRHNVPGPGFSGILFAM